MKDKKKNTKNKSIFWKRESKWRTAYSSNAKSKSEKLENNMK